MKIKKHLGFTSLRKALSACFNQILEHRQVGKVDYSIHDTLMSGFACIHFQHPSLLQFQKRLNKKLHKSNLQTLFGATKIPEYTQLHNITDGVDSHHFSPFFDDYFYRLQRGKHLQQFQLFPQLYFVALDATDYFSSHVTSCMKCLRTKSTHKAKDGVNDLQDKHRDEESGIRYSYKALQIAVMHPNRRQVFH